MKRRDLPRVLVTIQASKQTHARRRICRAFAVMLLILTSHGPAMAQDKAAPQTQIVLLGTGTPLPDPERSGPCTAIVVNGTPYLVDVGTGVVRRAAAARSKGVKALEPTNLKIAFITHLHSDHTLGFADIMLTPWIMGRHEPLEVYGPPGTAAMAGHLQKAYETDIKTRTEGLEHSNTTGYRVNVHEIKPGPVYKVRQLRGRRESWLRPIALTRKYCASLARWMQPQTVTAATLEQEHLRELESQRRHLTHLLVMEHNRGARVSDASVVRLNRSLINQIKKQIEKLDLLIKEHIEQSPGLSAKAEKLTSIKGVGLRTAALLLGKCPS